MTAETHNLKPIYNSHSVCSDCGACSCHTPHLISELCADVYSGAHRTFDHNGAAAESEKALNELRKKLNGGTDENEAKFLFELRRTALHWVERQTTAKNMSPQQLQQFVEATENFLRTGRFQNIDKAASSDG